MIAKNLTPFAWGRTVTARQARALELSLVVRSTWVLAPDQELTCIEDPLEQGFLSGDTFEDDDINQVGQLVHASDFAAFKLNSEVSLRGSCHPAGGPATNSTVRFAVGDWSKSLQVVGPRTYKRGMLIGGKASEPQPFASMPLTWHNAYGGDDFADNPVGRGHRGEELPTLEPAEKPIKKVGQKGAEPATFLPLSPHWPQRAGKRGKNYGADWKKHRAPFYSDDFDWTYFQAAPDDQQIDGYLRGDEQLEFENLHPDAAVWTTRLPGVRVRTFVKTADGKTHEPTMNLDTLHADLEDGKLYLTWRGLSPITQLDTSDVAVVLIVQENLADEPEDPQVYIRQLAEFEADPSGLNAAMPAGFMMFTEAIDAIEQAELHDQPLPDIEKIAKELPPDCPFPPWFLAAAAGNEDPLGVKDQFPEGLLEGSVAAAAPEAGGLSDPANAEKLLEDVAKLKDDPGAIVQILEAVTSLLPPDKQGAFKEGAAALGQVLDTTQGDLGNSVFAAAADNAPAAQTAKPMAEQYGDMMQTANSEIATGAEIAGDNADAAAKVTEAKGNLAKAPQTMDEAVARSMETVDGIELPEMPEIPDTEADLAAQAAQVDRDEARLRSKIGDHPMLGVFDMSRNLIENAPRPADVAPDLSAIPAALQSVQATLAEQGVSAAAMAPLAALTAKVSAFVDKIPKPPALPEGEFVAKNLRGRDFSNQDLRGQCFVKSDLTGACFLGTDLTGADLGKADLTGADLTDAKLTDATLTGATLSKAVLKNVVAHNASFKDTKLDGADFTAADLHGAKLMSARGPKVLFADAVLTEIDGRFADLSKSDFRGAKLGGANLSFATMTLLKADGADFREATLDIARFDKSRLQGCCFQAAKCNLGSFVSSDLTKANLRECNFESADLMKAVLDDADFLRAKLHRVQMRDTTGSRTQFQYADLSGCSVTGAARFTQCDFRHSTGSRSIWMEVDFTGSTFRHAKFDHAYFDGARGTDIDFIATTMKHANLRKVSFQRISFACADLASAVFQEATLDDGDFLKANCYDAKFLGAKAVRCRFEDAFLVGAQMDDPDASPPTPRGD